MTTRPSQAQTRFVINGHTVDVKEITTASDLHPADPLVGAAQRRFLLSIDGHSPFEATQSVATGEVYSYARPYEQFTSAKELARAVISDVEASLHHRPLDVFIP